MLARRGDRFALADAAAWLAAWADAADLRRVALVGHSMGDAIALETAPPDPIWSRGSRS